jgi:hypothetical protein
MYKVFFVEKAQSDLDWFRKNDKNSYLKCFDLVRELMLNPMSPLSVAIMIDRQKNTRLVSSFSHGCNQPSFPKAFVGNPGFEPLKAEFPLKSPAGMTS